MRGEPGGEHEEAVSRLNNSRKIELKYGTTLNQEGVHEVKVFWIKYPLKDLYVW